MTSDLPIAVGTDGSPSSLPAVSWAAREAALLNVPLTVKTTLVVPGITGVPVPLRGIYFENLGPEAGAAITAQAACVAADATPDTSLDIRTMISTGTPASELV